MEDISKDLLKRIRNRYDLLVTADTRVQLLKSKVSKDWQDADELAFRYGKHLAEAFKEIKGGDLPNERLYYNIADKVITPMMTENVKVVQGVSEATQSAMNKAAGRDIGIVKLNYDYQRIHDIVWKASQYEKFEDAKWLLDKPVIENAQGVVSSYMKAYGERIFAIGGSPKIIRTSSGYCCDWCQSMVGVYEYPNVPDDVYLKHANCTCTVEYIDDDGVENVHTKERYAMESASARKNYSSLIRKAKG